MKKTNALACEQRSWVRPEAVSTLLAIIAIALGIWVQSPSLHLSLTARAGFALVPVALASLAGRRYGAGSKRRGFVPFVVWVAGIWTATGAGLSICHLIRRLSDQTFDWIALAFTGAGCLTWWAITTGRRRRSLISRT
jgi:hypothetical protein